MLAVLNVAATHRDPALARQAWRLLVRTTSLAPARWRNNPPPGRVQVRCPRASSAADRCGVTVDHRNLMHGCHDQPS